jgi:hypothetical protein
MPLCLISMPLAYLISMPLAYLISMPLAYLISMPLGGRPGHSRHNAADSAR